MKVAFITGGAKGIGSAIVKRFIKDGYKVAFTYNNSENKAKALVDELGENCKAYKLDITDSCAVNDVVADVEKTFGEISVLVNNAGITRDAMFHKMTDAQWNAVMNVNIGGMYNCCKQVIGKMREQAYGRIDGIVINPAAYTHTSVAILDALKAVSIPAVEVHLSDVSAREPFRQISYAGMACQKTYAGFGFEGYKKAIDYLCETVVH